MGVEGDAPLSAFTFCVSPARRNCICGEGPGTRRASERSITLRLTQVFVSLPPTHNEICALKESDHRRSRRSYAAAGAGGVSARAEHDAFGFRYLSSGIRQVGWSDEIFSCIRRGSSVFLFPENLCSTRRCSGRVLMPAASCIQIYFSCSSDDPMSSSARGSAFMYKRP
jgi:hypothetical protein